MYRRHVVNPTSAKKEMGIPIILRTRNSRACMWNQLYGIGMTVASTHFGQRVIILLDAISFQAAPSSRSVDHPVFRDRRRI